MQTPLIRLLPMEIPAPLRCWEPSTQTSRRFLLRPQLQILFITPTLGLGIDPNASTQVNYQQLGTAVSIQAVNPNTSAPYQLSDLAFDPGGIGVSDPSLIGSMLHGAGNPSWYVGSATNALHIVDLQNPGQHSYFQPGLQWHVDAYNPTYGLPTLLQHFGTEVIPGNGMTGSRGTAYCSVNGGCR